MNNSRPHSFCPTCGCERDTIAQLEAHRNQVERERDGALAVLRQLVALKDEKDRHGKTIAYETFQPLAWENARRLLAALATNQPGGQANG